MIPILAIALSGCLFPRGDGNLQGGWVLVASALIAGLAYYDLRPSILSAARSFGVGLVPGNLMAAEYFRKNHLTGPIMNNFDVGGYLIYTLPANERVFVDNRPEAYPASFFKDTYIPMLSDDAVWRREEELFHFNTIIFDYRQRSHEAEAFVVRRLQDPEWAPVFDDRKVLIWLRRTPQNQPIIRRDEIPRRPVW